MTSLSALITRDDCRRVCSTRLLLPTLDFCVGDSIIWKEAVFRSLHPLAPTGDLKFSGHRLNFCHIIESCINPFNDRLMLKMVVVQSSGYNPLDTGKELIRLERTIKRNGVFRLYWANESVRHHYQFTVRLESTTAWMDRRSSK